jgi:hypothetical protein
MMQTSQEIKSGADKKGLTTQENANSRIITVNPGPVRYIKRVALCLFFILLFAEPLLANKFETIGGGVVGSPQMKVEYLKVVAYITGAIFLITAILAIVMKNKNAQTLNYTMWKPSAAIFFLLSIASFAAAVLMK